MREPNACADRELGEVSVDVGLGRRFRRSFAAAQALCHLMNQAELLVLGDVKAMLAGVLAFVAGLERALADFSAGDVQGEFGGWAAVQHLPIPPDVDKTSSRRFLGGRS
jgi:hypothetical protein